MASFQVVPSSEQSHHQHPSSSPPIESPEPGLCLSAEEISPGSASDHMGGPFPHHRPDGCTDVAMNSSQNSASSNHHHHHHHHNNNVAYDFAPSWKHVQAMEVAGGGGTATTTTVTSAPPAIHRSTSMPAPEVTTTGATSPILSQVPHRAQHYHHQQGNSSAQQQQQQQYPNVPRVVSTVLPASESNQDVEMMMSSSSPQPSETTSAAAPSILAPAPSLTRSSSTSLSPRSSPRSKKNLVSNGSAGGSSTKPTVRRGRATAAKLPRNNSVASTTTIESAVSVSAELNDASGSCNGNGNNNRRQKRLERNRESARLSRRRRKQYLEVLEERVTKFSHEMDKGRREHVAACVPTLRQKRTAVLTEHEQEQQQLLLLLQPSVSPAITAKRVHTLLTGLSRSSQEMMVTSTFRSQQLKSFVLPPSTKFIMWLTLQTDAYFRGGRAASERLSAARIGDRLLNSGTDRVTPCESMWPLFCSEVGLSYDQEEKVRNYQRTILQTPESWLDRHTAFATRKLLESAHESVQAVTLRFGQRERCNLNILTDEQKLKFLSWSEKNRERIAKLAPPAKTLNTDQRYQLHDEHHTAGNLYILNHRFQTVLKKVPRAAPLVTGILLRKLSRRPSFESLGSAEARKEGMARSDSCASMSSMKRDASEISMEGSNNGEERPHVPPISPSEAQASFTSVVDEKLGQFKEIIPPTPSMNYSGSMQLPLPAPTPVSEMMRPKTHTTTTHSAPAPAQYQPPPQEHMPPTYSYHQPAAAAPPPAPMASASVAASNEYQSQQLPISGHHHERAGSFLPPHLNIVPEEIWPVDAADDFLMKLVDEDWAIGEGIDMEMDVPPPNP